MKQFPVFLNLESRRCLVIGGDHAAQCKVSLLLEAGADIHLEATSLTPELQAWVSEGRVTLLQATVNSIDLHTYALTIIANCEKRRAAHLSAQCQAQGVPVNVVDQPQLCSFTVPSIVDRAPITIAIGSAGSSPIMARRIRAQIDALVPRTAGPLAALLGKFRPRVAECVSPADRRSFWDAILDGPVAAQALSGDVAAAEQSLEQTLQRPTRRSQQTREAYIVDVRHGSAELMTLAAVQALHRAEHIVMDGRIPESILALSRRDAHRHRSGCQHRVGTQATQFYSRQLAALAQAGEPLVLLASGSWFNPHTRDELVDALSAQGILCHVILGVEAPLIDQRIAS